MMFLVPILGPLNERRGLSRVPIRFDKCANILIGQILIKGSQENISPCCNDADTDPRFESLPLTWGSSSLELFHPTAGGPVRAGFDGSGLLNWIGLLTLSYPFVQ